jgi:UPF0755 protein
MKNRRPCLPWVFFLGTLTILALLAVLVYVPAAARRSFGEPSGSLSAWQRINYGYLLAWNAGDLTQPAEAAGQEQLFVIQPGESVVSISSRLEQAGLIRSGSALRTYLLWKGYDTIIQSGTYHISPAQTATDIAGMLKSSSQTEVHFTVLAGWRMEEIGESLPTSGLDFPVADFLIASAVPPDFQDLIPEGRSAEGFLFPGEYVLPRSTTSNQLVASLLAGFRSNVSVELQAAFVSHGLSVYQGVILASILQREAVVGDEMPLLASVFYNRLAVGMKLQTDPTVQYALGFNPAQGTWWTNPLSSADLQFDSPYNTYIYPGLPPGPISNPGLVALEAAAYPAESTYYYFQARCDGSGLHNFSETYEQHQQNNCP